MGTEIMDTVNLSYREEIESLKSVGVTDIEEAKRKAIAIIDTETFGAAASLLMVCKDRIKRIVERLKEPKAAARKAWQGWVDLENELVEPYERIEKEIIKPAMLKYDTEQETKRRIEQERINRELKQQEEERRLAMATELAESGKHEQADKVLEMPEQAPQVVLPKANEVKGISYRMIYSAEVFDVKALCKAIAEGKIETAYVNPNFVALNGLAKSLKESMNAQWEQFGVRARGEKIMSATGGR